MPKYTPAEGSADMNILFEQANIPMSPTHDNLLNSDFFPAMFELMSDGEIHFGQVDGTTVFSERFPDFAGVEPLWQAALTEHWKPETKNIQRFAPMVGTILANEVHSGRMRLDEAAPLAQPWLETATDPMINHLRTGDFLKESFGESDKLPSVMDLGAGVLGARYINWVIANLRHEQPAQYIPINRSIMANAYLNQTHDYGSLESLVTKWWI